MCSNQPNRSLHLQVTNHFYNNHLDGKVESFPYVDTASSQNDVHNLLLDITNLLVKAKKIFKYFTCF